MKQKSVLRLAMLANKQTFVIPTERQAEAQRPGGRLRQHQKRMNDQDQSKTEGGGAVASSDLLAAKIAAFRFHPQFVQCNKDGTCQKMTPERKAKMPLKDQQRYDEIYAFQKPNIEMYHGGPLFCGKNPGICSANHCRWLHCG